MDERGWVVGVEIMYVIISVGWRACSVVWGEREKLTSLAHGAAGRREFHVGVLVHEVAKDFLVVGANVTEMNSVVESARVAKGADGAYVAVFDTEPGFLVAQWGVDAGFR